MQLRFLLSLLSKHGFFGISTGIDELMVDGLLANIGIVIVPLFCSSSLAKEVPVRVARVELILSLSVFHVRHHNEFLEKDFGANQM